MQLTFMKLQICMVLERSFSLMLDFCKIVTDGQNILLKDALKVALSLFTKYVIGSILQSFSLIPC